MEELDLLPTFIPAWLLAVVMIYTGIIWIVCRKKSIKIGSRIFAYTLIVWGVLYGLFQFTTVSGEARGFMTRVMLLLICFSQSIPLTVAYIRSFKK